jgi:hypothetical protein
MNFIKKSYNGFLTKLNLLIFSGITAFAGGLTVDDFQNADLQKGAENLKNGVKTGADIALTIIMYIAILVGVVFLLWGAYPNMSQSTL